MEALVWFALVSPLVWGLMYFLVRRRADGRRAYWAALIIYLLTAIGCILGITLADGMEALPYIIFGGMGLSVYTLFCLAFAINLRLCRVEDPVIRRLPRHDHK